MRLPVLQGWEGVQVMTSTDVTAARNWIAGVWGAKLAKGLSRAQVIDGIARHYDGGWDGFRADGIAS